MGIVIIGAGLAGLACGRHLSAAGKEVLILDKGRGIGGRLATRRGEGGQFDHGSPLIAEPPEDLAEVLTLAQAAGTAAPWKGGVVGVPGMSTLARHLAEGLEVRNQCTVTALTPKATGWQVHMEEESLAADQIVCTLPAPQTAALLGPDHPLSAELAQVRYDPCLTLMAQLDSPVDMPAVTRPAQGPFAKIIREEDKPGRPAAPALTVHATPAWSRTHLELPRAEVAQMMAALLCTEITLAPERIRQVQGHRWRYARVARGLGQDHLQADDNLFLGGDWAPGGGTTAAWRSGQAMAAALLSQG